MSPFCGATDTPVLDFWWCLLWVSKLEWAALFELCGGIHVTCSLRFPLVQHLATSWRPAWQLSHLFHIPMRHWWDSKPGAIMLPLTVWDHVDALPTELSGLGREMDSLKKSLVNHSRLIAFNFRRDNLIRWRNIFYL